MRVLIITNLFPNKSQPDRGVFNKQQFLELKNFCEFRVVAPLPWMPKSLAKGDKAFLNEVPAEEIIEGIKVYHPRYLVTPKVGRNLYGFFYFLGIKNTVKKIYQTFSFDAIFATWAYPDAFAAALVSRIFEKPLIIKVHGTDINVAGQYFLRRKMMAYAFDTAQKVIAVSIPLREKIIAMGIPPQKVVLVSNGLNKEIFRKMDKKECQRNLSLDSNKKHVVYIGNLVPIKGVKYLVEAFRDMPENISLNIIGDGELKMELEKESRTLNLTNRINFLGKRPHQEMPLWFNAADVFCLPSLNEGCPNVILEAMACGAPIVASRVGGIPDLVSADQGLLIEPADPEALTQALKAVITRPTNGAQKIEILTWKENAQKVYSIFQDTK